MAVARVAGSRVLSAARTDKRNRRPDLQILHLSGPASAHAATTTTTEPAASAATEPASPATNAATSTGTPAAASAVTAVGPLEFWRFDPETERSIDACADPVRPIRTARRQRQPQFVQQRSLVKACGHCNLGDGRQFDSAAIVLAWTEQFDRGHGRDGLG